MALMLLIGAQTAAVAQELTVSDIEFIDEGYNEEEYPMIILTKEGSVLNVHLLHYLAHPDTEEFVITPNMSGGSDGEPYSVSIGVENIDDSETTVITTFGVSFNVHGIEANSFYLSCWWYKGMVSLTEGDPLELWENKNIDKDGVIYTLDNKTKTAALSVAGYVEGEYNIPEELDYEGETFLLTSIGIRAFSGNTSLTSVVIPKSVTNIGGGAFYRCSNLTDLYCHAENVPTTGVNVFTESSVATATLHVPAGSVEEYKTTSPWNEFGIIEALPTPKILPFVQDGKVWSYYVTNFNHEWEETYSLEGDTTISSRKCVKLYYNQNLYKGAMFEEGGNVYFIAPGSTTPALMYDFSSEPGTIITVGPYELRINEKKLAKYRGEYLKIIDYSPLEDEYGEYEWIDGLGIDCGGLLTDIVEGTAWRTGGERYLKTCSINGEVVYDEDDFYTSAQIVNENEVNYATDQMATIVLPTAPDASKGKYYRLDRCEDGQIIFEQELQPQAHIPYIIVPSEDFSIDTSTLDLAGLSNDTVSIGGISFIGSYVGETLNEPEGFYFDIIDTTPDCSLSLSGETGKVAHIGALRAYLQVSWDEPYNHGGSKAPGEKLGILLKDYGTGIGDAKRLNDKGKMINDNSIYDLSGRRISGKPARGVYIKDGKKVAIK